MPRAPMDKAAISEKKEKILDIAAEIIMEDGYQSLSMRKIGKKIGMTAANLYNYYSNKDELNIAIRTRAGKILYAALMAAYKNGQTISEKIHHMSKAYIEFGLLKPNYYSIMFDMQTPKFADYVGSPLEKIALEEKISSEKSLDLMDQCTQDFVTEGYKIPENTNLFLILIWSQLHGLISLYNNKLISEINETPEKTVNEATELAYEIFFSFITKDAQVK